MRSLHYALATEKAYQHRRTSSMKARTQLPADATLFTGATSIENQPDTKTADEAFAQLADVLFARQL